MAAFIAPCILWSSRWLAEGAFFARGSQWLCNLLSASAAPVNIGSLHSFQQSPSAYLHKSLAEERVRGADFKSAAYSFTG